MCEKVFRLEESSDLPFSFACTARRNRYPNSNEHVLHVRECGGQHAHQRVLGYLFLHAQCRKNMFRLSSAEKGTSISITFHAMAILTPDSSSAVESTSSIKFWHGMVLLSNSVRSGHYFCPRL